MKFACCKCNKAFDSSIDEAIKNQIATVTGPKTEFIFVCPECIEIDKKSLTSDEKPLD